MTTDAELVRAAQGGDTASLGLLLERYRAPLYGLALQILGYVPEAQDAVHDAFLVALRKIDQVREPAAVGGWLHATLRNVCRMRLRVGQGEMLFDGFPYYAERRPSEPSAEEAIDQLAMREWVWTALGQLPETLRITAMLRYFGSYSSYDEISAILGVPVGTVCSRLSQVKLKLAEALLETAGVAHGEARRLTDSRARYFTAALEEMNRGRGYGAFSDGFWEDSVCTFSDGTVFWDRESMLRDIEGSLESGMKMHPTNIIASRDVAIVEASFENPPDDPHLCPPAACQVHLQRGDRTHQLRLYFAPFPPGSETGSDT